MSETFSTLVSPVVLFVLGAALASALSLFLLRVFARMQSWSEDEKYRRDYFSARADLEATKSDNALLRAKLVDSTEERDMLRTVLDAHKKSRVAREQTINELSAQVGELQAEIEGRDKALGEVKSQHEELALRHTALAERAAGLDDELTSAREAIHQLKEESDALAVAKTALSQKVDELALLSNQLRDSESARAALQSELEKINESRAALKVEFDALGAKNLESQFALEAMQKSHAQASEKLEVAHLEGLQKSQDETRAERNARLALEETLKQARNEIEALRQKHSEALAELNAQSERMAENDAAQLAASSQLKTSLDSLLADKLDAERRAAEAREELDKLRKTSAAHMASMMAEANALHLALKNKDAQLAALQNDFAQAQPVSVPDGAVAVEPPQQLTWEPLQEPPPASVNVEQPKTAPPEAPSPKIEAVPLPASKLAPDVKDEPEIVEELPPPPPRPRLSKPRSILTSLGREAICPQYLSEVRGIGEVYEQKLYAAGIGTFWELAHTSDEELERIFDAKDFQDVNCQVIRDDAMRLAIETGTLGREWDGSQPDNLTEIEGIGRTFEKRLFDAGVCTFEALARLSPARLEEICGSGGLRRPNYSEWIAEARAKL